MPMAPPGAPPSIMRRPGADQNRPMMAGPMPSGPPMAVGSRPDTPMGVSMPNPTMQNSVVNRYRGGRAPGYGNTPPMGRGGFAGLTPRM